MPGLAVVGEGLADPAPQPLQVTVPHGVPVYGQRPSYGDDLVGGIGFAADRQEAPVRHVVTLGADGLFIEGRPAPAADVVTVASAPSRPGLLSRARAALGRLRGRR
ncbi:MAG: hypothetical protein ACTHPS_08560 [Streptosporangiaceae bacterium]